MIVGKNMNLRPRTMMMNMEESESETETIDEYCEDNKWKDPDYIPVMEDSEEDESNGEQSNDEKISEMQQPNMFETPKRSDKTYTLHAPRKNMVVKSVASISRCYFSRIILMNARKVDTLPHMLNYHEVLCTIQNPEHRYDKTKHKYMGLEFLFPKTYNHDKSVYVNIMNIVADDFAMSEVWDKSYYSTDTLAMLSLQSTKHNIIYTYYPDMECYSYWMQVPNFVFTDEDLDHVEKHMRMYDRDDHQETFKLSWRHFQKLRFILHTLEYTASTYSWFKDEFNHVFKEFEATDDGLYVRSTNISNRHIK